jgi:acyl carrier protein
MDERCDWRRLADFIQARLTIPLDGPILEETPLVSSELLDSLILVELVMHVQATFGVRIPASRLTVDDFDTLGRIARLVRSLQSAT